MCGLGRSFEKNQMGDAGALGIGQGLKDNNALGYILYEAPCPTCQRLAIILCTCTCSLHDNDIGEAGALGLAEGIKSNTFLKQLKYTLLMRDAKRGFTVDCLRYSMYNNRIGDLGATAFGNMLSSNTVLQQLQYV
jgi:hypothetical protein